MSQPTSPNRHFPFRKITIVRKGTAYRAISVTEPGARARAILEDGSFTTSDALTLTEGRGVTWIDGHHDYDAEEVRELLAANALAERRDLDLDAQPMPVRNPYVGPSKQFDTYREATTDRFRRESEARWRNPVDDEG